MILVRVGVRAKISYNVHLKRKYYHEKDQNLGYKRENQQMKNTKGIQEEVKYLGQEIEENV